MLTPNKTSKVIDTVHAGATPASPTSRPVLVTNRPFMKADPMLSSSANQIYGTERASGEQAKPSDKLVSSNPVMAPSVASKNIPVPDITEEKTEKSVNEAPPALSEPESAKAEDQSAVLKGTKESSDVAKTVPEKSSDVSSETDTDSDDTVDDNEAENENEDQTVRPEVAAEAARNAELEKLIAEGTYAVDIGSAKRHHKLLLGFLLVLILALVTLDVLLDIGLLTISGLPHTDLL